MERPPLYNPDRLHLDDAYRSLPNGGKVEISFEHSQLKGILKDLEAIGYIAIKIEYDQSGKIASAITAYKGKHGACYDKGHKAIYIGAALAALDDDNHLLIAGKEKSVCQKTAAVYQLPPFEDLMTIVDPIAQKKQGSGAKPDYYQIDSFEEDQEKLFEILNFRKKKEDRSNLFYPGPFKLLVLTDGTIVRRGQMNSVPLDEERLLMKSDNMQKTLMPGGADAVFFQDIYDHQGSKWLITDFKPVQNDIGEVVTDLSFLNKIHPKLRIRLQNLIENKRKYFILTGSDPSDRFGCCPSQEVAEANRLVREGVLGSIRSQAGQDDCPVTVYAFKNEIIYSTENLDFRENEDLRISVKSILNKGAAYRTKSIIRWVLISFIAVSLFFAYSNFSDNEDKQSLTDILGQMTITQDLEVLILLFHYENRCPQCTRMEFFTRTVLEGEFPETVVEKKIRFELINMDQIDYRDLTRKAGLFSATMMLLKYDQGELKESTILKDAWNLYLDESSFRNMLIREVNQFLERK